MATASRLPVVSALVLKVSEPIRSFEVHRAVSPSGREDPHRLSPQAGQGRAITRTRNIAPREADLSTDRHIWRARQRPEVAPRRVETANTIGTDRIVGPGWLASVAIMSRCENSSVHHTANFPNRTRERWARTGRGTSTRLQSRDRPRVS